MYIIILKSVLIIFFYIVSFIFIFLIVTFEVIIFIVQPIIGTILVSEVILIRLKQYFNPFITMFKIIPILFFFYCIICFYFGIQSFDIISLVVWTILKKSPEQRVASEFILIWMINCFGVYIVTNMGITCSLSPQNNSNLPLPFLGGY